MAPPKKKRTAPDADRTIANLAVQPKEITDASTIADLRPAGYNPRFISAEKLRMLRDAMVEFGDIGGVVFNTQTGRLIGGHQRVKNLDPNWPITKEAITDNTGTVAVGYIETPSGRFNYREVNWDEQKEKAANIAANQHGGQFDEDLLAQMTEELYSAGYNMELVGFDQAEVDALLGLNKPSTKGQEDPNVEPVEKPFVKLGDLWLLGDHRLLCGDSTSIADVDKLLNGEKADLCVTDPPYNVNYESKVGKIENDNMSNAAFEEFLKSVFSMLHHALKPGGCFYIYHAEGQNLGHSFSAAIVNTAGLLLKQKLVWVKNTAPMSRQDYSWKHEPILYGWKSGAAHFYDGDFTRTTVIDDDVDINKLDKKQLQTLIQEMRNKEPSSVIRVDKPQKSEWHPTMKPVRLFEKNIYASSRPKEVVIDLFSGSATTIITCEKTGRRGRAMEFDPCWAQASLNRFWEYCGKEPLLLLPDGTTKTMTDVEKERKK